MAQMRLNLSIEMDEPAGTDAQQAERAAAVVLVAAGIAARQLLDEGIPALDAADDARYVPDGSFSVSIFRSE